MIRRPTKFFCLALILFSISKISSAASADKPPKAKVRLALNWKPEPQFGGFYSAQLNEIDKKNGIEFELVPGGAGTPVVQMVASGQFDFGIASADEVIISRARGSDVVALFAVYQTSPQAILTHSERAFESLADVFKSNGTVAMQKGLPYAVFLTRKYAGSMKASIVPLTVSFSRPIPTPFTSLPTAQASVNFSALLPWGALRANTLKRPATMQAFRSVETASTPASIARYSRQKSKV